MSDVAKGFQFKYENFLWIEIHEIRKLQRMGDPAGALKYALGLVDYLADEIKQKFRDKAKKIKAHMQQIEAGAQGPYAFNRSLNRNRALQSYAFKMLPTFIDELSTMLDQRGYMEKKSMRLKRADFRKLEETQ